MRFFALLALLVLLPSLAQAQPPSEKIEPPAASSDGFTLRYTIERIEVEERSPIILNAIYLGTSEATDVWGGNPADLGRAGASLGQRIPADFTADLGLRLDTYISICFWFWPS